MIRVELLFFAQIREAVGHRSERVEIEDGTTVEDLVNVLRRRPEWRAVESLPLRFAVNERVVDSGYTLCDGERLALLTPVSGG